MAQINVQPGKCVSYNVRASTHKVTKRNHTVQLALLIVDNAPTTGAM